MFSTIFRRPSACDASRVHATATLEDTVLSDRLMRFSLVREETRGRKVYIRQQFSDRANDDRLDWWA